METHSFHYVISRLSRVCKPAQLSDSSVLRRVCWVYF